MRNTIAVVAEKFGVTPDTLRYYDKEGLLPFVDRGPGGVRIFKDSDYPWLEIITCMKNTGMQIKDIKIFVDLCMQGDPTLQQRYDIIMSHKSAVEQQIKELQSQMKILDYKEWYYKTALEAGTADIHKGKCREDHEKAVRADRRKRKTVYA
jgi:DNA-binding transcriptional MerR regulator